MNKSTIKLLEPMTVDDDERIRNCVIKGCCRIKLASGLCGTCYSRKYYRTHSEDPVFMEKKLSNQKQYKKKNRERINSWAREYYRKKQMAEIGVKPDVIEV